MHLCKTILAAAGSLLATGAFALGTIENPQPDAIESGITAITGWNCQAGQITIQIDDGPLLVAPYGSQRADTSQVCGGQINTGFSYLINYNTMPIGQHTIRAYADGVQFASVTFIVINLGGEFLTGKAGEYYLNNFPDYGKRTRVTWQQSKQNFVVTSTDTTVAPLDGTYYGGVVSTNTECTTSTNNGTFFEADRFTVTTGANSALKIESANSAATCTYNGTALYSTNGGDIVVQNGTLGCNNGLQGTWTSDRMTFDPIGLLANLNIKFTVGETCSTAAHLGGAR